MKNLLLIAVALLLLGGCASFNNTAGKLLASTAITADKAMQGWATYVVINKVPDNDPSQVKVRAAYAKYQMAMAAAQAAYIGATSTGDKTIWGQAAAMLTSSASELSAIVLSFTSQPTKP